MRKMILLLPLLAGCQSTGGGLPQGYEVADPPIPDEVLSGVPADVRLDQIVVRDGCYYYLGAEGQIYPIPSRAMRDGGFGGPYCVG